MQMIDTHYAFDLFDSWQRRKHIVFNEQPTRVLTMRSSHHEQGYSHFRPDSRGHDLVRGAIGRGLRRQRWRPCAGNAWRGDQRRRGPHAARLRHRWCRALDPGAGNPPEVI